MEPDDSVERRLKSCDKHAEMGPMPCSASWLSKIDPNCEFERVSTHEKEPSEQKQAKKRILQPYLDECDISNRENGPPSHDSCGSYWYQTSNHPRRKCAVSARDISSRPSWTLGHFGPSSVFQVLICLVLLSVINVANSYQIEQKVEKHPYKMGLFSTQLERLREEKMSWDSAFNMR